MPGAGIGPCDSLLVEGYIRNPREAAPEIGRVLARELCHENWYPNDVVHIHLARLLRDSRGLELMNISPSREKLVPNQLNMFGRFLLPDGTERYLVDENMLLSITKHLGGRLLDPLKTTVVERQPAMATWIVKKNQT